ncbi:MAG: NADH-quinone oxidoreductase subunit K [Methylocella sp.]
MLDILSIIVICAGDERGNAGWARRRGAGGAWPLWPHHQSPAAAQNFRLQSYRQRRLFLFGIIARKGAAAGFAADPVLQAMVITGIVVAFSASALAIALVLRLFRETGRVTLRPDALS